MMTSDRVSGARLADGATHEADMVVNCAGRWTNEVVREAGLHLPLAPTVGFLVFHATPVASSLSRVVRRLGDRRAARRRGTVGAALESDRCDVAHRH